MNSEKLYIRLPSFVVSFWIFYINKVVLILRIRGPFPEKLKDVTVVQERNFSPDPVKVIWSHILVHCTKHLVYYSSLPPGTILCKTTNTTPIRSIVSFPTPCFLIIASFFHIWTHIATPQKLSCTNKIKIISYTSNTTFRIFLSKKNI